MRITRLVIGALVILVTLWILVGEQMAGASADAVVNARLSTLRAPVAGQIDLPERPFGSAVAAGEELGSVTDRVVDRISLNDLEMERAFAQAALTRAESMIAPTRDEIARLGERTGRYRTARVAELESRLEHARARLTLLEATDPATSPPAVEDTDADDLTMLLDQGQTGAGPDARVPAIALDYARERVDLLEVEIEAAQAGVFLGDGYNDAPWSEQRSNELRELLRGQEVARTEAATRLAAAVERVADESLAVRRRTSAPLRATVDGRVWEIRAADGEFVQRGQDVMVLLDCSSLLVTLSVTESIYNRLRVGDSARFLLSGDGREFEATVARLGGIGALTIFRNLAVAPSEKHLERWNVTLLVPELSTAGDLACPVGRTGRAFFAARPLDWLRDIF